MGAEQRVAFIGKTSQDPTSFLESVHLKPIRLHPDLSPTETLYVLAYEHTKNASSSRPDPLLIIADNPEELLASAQTLQSAVGQTPSLSVSPEKIKSSLQSLTIIKYGADFHTNARVDPQTGISVAQIKKGEVAFPTHPTPAS